MMLQDKEREFHLLVETISELVWIIRPDGRSEYYNQRWYEYTGVTIDQTRNDGWSQCVHPDDRERTIAAWHDSLQTGQPYENEYRLKNARTGEYRWFIGRALPLKDEHGVVLRWFGTCTDIHNNKQVEEALRISEARFKRLFESTIIGMMIASFDGRIFEANEAFLNMVGYTRADVLSGAMSWRKMTPPEFRDRDAQVLDELYTTGKATPWEKEYIRKDGSRVPVLLGTVVLEGANRQAISFVLNITERKEFEKRKDEFISMAGHELRTPLTTLRLLMQMFAKKLTKSTGDENKELHGYLSRMDAQITTLSRLINSLLDVSKIQAGRLDYNDEVLDLDKILYDTIETVQQANPLHILIIQGTLHKRIIADRHRLGQVFSNLIGNAIKYSPQADKVQIFLSATDDVAMISIQDEGVGIPEEQQKRIFERFYRADALLKIKAISGLGMGLYISNEIVKHYKGEITVKSEEGQGSTFSVSLPVLHS